MTNDTKNVITGAKPLEKALLGEYRLSEVRAACHPAKLTFDITGGSSVMPRGAWWGPYRVLRDGYPDYLTEEYYRYLRDTGLNFVCAIPNNMGSHPDIVLSALDLCRQFNIGFFVNDYSFRECDEALMRRNIPRYIEHPACLGVHAYDEPYPEDLEKLKKAVRLYQSITPVEKPLYFNLFPSYGKFGDDDVRLRNYEKYLDDCCAELEVKMLSYDYYAFKKREYEWGRLKLFFDNLSLARAVAKKRGIPFWTFVQAGDAFTCDGAEGKEEFPTPEMLLWNVNTNLAYGSKAMQYFTFIQPAAQSRSLAAADMNCRVLGMLGADGRKNIWYDAVKRANAVIEQVESYLMNAESLGVMISGEKTASLIAGTEKLSSYRELVCVDGTECVVGCFDYNGSTLLYVVNNDYENSGTVKFNFDDIYAFEVIKGGKSSAYAGREWSIRLSAGEGVLIRLL